MSKTGIGSHTKPNQGDTNTWLTPRDLIEALGPFDLDPCAAPSPRPWPTAKNHIELPDDGLKLPWSGYWCALCGATEQLIDGDPSDPVHRATLVCARCFTPFVAEAAIQPYRVWMNPPYGKEVDAWMDKLSQHKSGLALIFARTETATWHTYIWPRAHSVFFFNGRLWFYRPDGSRGTSNAGGPSALISYSRKDTDGLMKCWENGLIKGTLVQDWVGKGAWNG